MTVELEHLHVKVADGLRFHVARAGSGPAVVLLHGFTGSTETWTELQTSLADRFTTIAIDITGHGLSDAPVDPHRYSLQRFAGDLTEILDALEIQRVAVLGYSMGGRAALRFMLQHRERVAGLVLESTSPGISDEVLRRERIAADNTLADVIEAAGIEAFVDYWEQLPLWASLSALPDPIRARLRDQRLKNRTTGLANSLRGAGAGVDEQAFERTAACRTLVLLIFGALDTKYVALGGIIEAGIPGSRRITVDAAGHMVHLEQPHQFRHVVRSFLDEMVTADGDWL